MRLIDRIKQSFLAIGLGAYLAVASAGGAQEVLPKPTPIVEVHEHKSPPLFVEYTADYQTKYVFRGLTYSEDPVIQHCIFANKGPWSVIGFANQDLNGQGLNEADITIEFSKPVHDGTLSAGYTYLSFPGTDIPDTQEVYAKFGLEGRLNPSFMVVQDFVDGRGTYAELGASHALGRFAADTTLGYNHGWYRDSSGFSHATLGLSISIPAGDVTLKPSVHVQKALSSDFQDEVWGGVSATVPF